MLFILHIPHLFTSRFVYVYNLLTKTQLPLKNSWNQILPGSEVMRKVNIEDASFVRFSE